jgi:hypothetical protein
MDSVSADPPTVIVPVPTGSEVGIVTEYTVGTPDDEMSDGRCYPEPATGAEILLHGAVGTHRLHEEGTTSTRFGALPPGQQVFQ